MCLHNTPYTGLYLKYVNFVTILVIEKTGHPPKIWIFKVAQKHIHC